MSRRRNSAHATPRQGKTKAHGRTAAVSHHHVNGRQGHGWFTEFAHAVARFAGKPASFLIALTCVLVWGLSGPLFGFSDTWQLVVNTATTIVTFLMVFLIQNTQNRDTLALQIKLADLIIAMRGTHNDMATAEDMSEADLETLHQEYRKRAELTGETLKKRRGAGAA